ncbi:MAG: PQQ-like beta-propeller repeat protein [Thermoanaerobaculia bacterium]|nr:PQQ-like beta-propeller repeat protein [Thermoanaerobaculia bacterium]
MLTPFGLLAQSASDPGWPQWRGPQRDGNAAGPTWADSLRGLQLLWRVDLGPGYSGPIVTEQQVFVAETVGGKTESVRALNRQTGEQQWRVSWPGEGKVPFFARANGDWIRATPAWDGENLYVGGMNEVLVKLDGATGRELWRVDFPRRFGTKVPDFGFASSPLVDGEAVFVQAANSLVKLDRQTGKTLWRQLESDGAIAVSGAFSSPVLAELSGRRQLVVQTRTTLYGLDPQSGTVLWSQDVPGFRGMNILTPSPYGDAILTSSYRQKSFLFGIEPEGDGWRVSELWTNKAHAYMSSPAIIGDHAYLHLGNQRLTCLDLRTGESRWTSQPFGKYWSVAIQGDRILALDADGELHLLRANPERLEILDSRQVSNSPTWGHLAVADGEVFIRELEAVAAYRWPAGN